MKGCCSAEVEECEIRITTEAKLPRGSKAAAPERLCLPPLPPGEQVRPNGDRLAVAVPVVRGGPGFSLFAAHDIEGRGSNADKTPHADPFMLCHASAMLGARAAPFCAHPHCGASVFTIFLSGTEVWPWDNVNGDEKHHLYPGGIYYVNTGQGCVHNESLAPLSVQPMSRASFDPSAGPEPFAASDVAETRLVQLWWDAMPEGPLPSVHTAVVAPQDVDVITDASGIAVRVLAGSYRGSKDVLPIATDARPLLILHVRVPAGAAGSLEPLPCSFNGFAWVVQGLVRVGHEDLEGFTAMGYAELPPGGTSLPLHNESGEPAELLVCIGEPQRMPHYKYVGYGGGMVHRSVDAVVAAMDSYEKDPKRFGLPESASPVDWSRYKFVNGFQDEGGEMMERSEDVVARIAWADATAFYPYGKGGF